jgi:hypothetical protein
MKLTKEQRDKIKVKTEFLTVLRADIGNLELLIKSGEDSEVIRKRIGYITQSLGCKYYLEELEDVEAELLVDELASYAN